MEGLQLTMGATGMSENRYSTAGWLAIVSALLFPAIFATGIMQTIIADKAFGLKGPMLGPSDLLGLLFTALTVYVLLIFRQFLNERHEYRGIDFLITLAVVWAVGFQLLGLLLDGVGMLAGSDGTGAYLVIAIAFMVGSMLSVGVIDLLVGIRLLKAPETQGDLFKIYACLNLACGIAELSLFLVPLALLFVPVQMIVLGLLLLKAKEAPEFV